MKVFIVTIMLLNYLLLFLSVCSYPTLNEKNQEISWEAWLLVDDQNSNRQQQPGQIAPKRRITPKSVFVAPMFSPEDLPPCAEGYSSDQMGRCVKIIKIDEDKHFDFLVSKLNERFGNLDYEDAFDEEPTRLEIPIDAGEDYYDYSNDTPQFDNMAIIVTPKTKEQKEEVSKVAKRDDQYGETTTDVTTTTTFSEDVATATTTTDEDVATTTTEDVATTVTDSSEDTTITTNSDNEDVTSTTTINEDVATTTIINEDIATTTISNDVTTTTEAPFTTTVATTPKITTYHPLATTYHPYFNPDSLKIGSRIKNFVKFPEDEPLPRSNHPQEGDFVRFPEDIGGYQQESSQPRTRNVDSQTGNFLNNNEIITPEPSERVLARFLSSKPVKRQHKWSSEERQHKPVVLRFPRKHLSFDLDKFKNGQFYRSLPMDDLTYLFGYKNAQSNNR